MKVVLTTPGKFHSFDLARQLHARGALTTIYTGYPMFKLKKEGIPLQLIRSFPWVQTLHMGSGHFKVHNQWLDRQLCWLSDNTLDLYAARTLPTCDIFLGFSNTGLITGETAKKRGALYLCDRAISHIRYQDTILREEFTRQNVAFNGLDSRTIQKEEQEYMSAAAITVGSSYVKRSFVQMGIEASKVYVIPYGVDLSKFRPEGEPDKAYFDVLFVGSASIRKGIPYLLEAFAKFQHPHKRLTLVGTIRPEVEPILAKYAAVQPIQCLGHQPQAKLKEIMSRSHVMVMPSVDEGLAMVQAQAMACGCPLISTQHSGAEDLITDGKEGFIVPIRDAQAITAKMEMLVQCPELRASMSAQALQRVQAIGGWNTYGDTMYHLFDNLLKARSK